MRMRKELKTGEEWRGRQAQREEKKGRGRRQRKFLLPCLQELWERMSDVPCLVMQGLTAQLKCKHSDERS